jgi:hypothetical protein
MHVGSRLSGKIILAFIAFLLSSFLENFTGGLLFHPPPTLTPTVCIYGKGNQNIVGPKSSYRPMGQKSLRQKVRLGQVFINTW